ncbi:hypothetical protein CVT24_010169 [Panaeolus cyanescens]|uniref:Uncharacterized protein n=1 Tax=Panaeolus cyanescens TaxID=181874 RepID=A0A409YW19_9AGAR|nr:hypothetical protein CVT24_010169 [Panaeolus cyanescens]
MVAKDVLSAPTVAVTFRPNYDGITFQGDEKTAIDNAFKEAVVQITEMKSVITAASTGDKTALWKIHNVFEAEVSITEMVEMINHLTHLAMDIVEINADLGKDTLAAVRAGKARISKLFFARTGPQEYMKALTLVHEGTHLRPGDKNTDDNFEWTNGEDSDLKVDRNKGPVCGYMDQQYWKVVKHLRSMAWRNADSWGVFGYYVVHGYLPPGLPKNPNWPANHDAKFTPPEHVKSTIVNAHRPDTALYFETAPVMSYLDPGQSSTTHQPHQPGSHAQNRHPTSGSHFTQPQSPPGSYPAGVSVSQIGAVEPHPFLTQSLSNLNLNQNQGYEAGSYDPNAPGPSYQEYYAPHPYPESPVPQAAEEKKPKKKAKKQEPSMMLELFTSGSSHKKKGKK